MVDGHFSTGRVRGSQFERGIIGNDDIGRRVVAGIAASGGENATTSEFSAH